MTRFRHLLVALIAIVVCAGQLQAQTGTVRGQVTDASIGGGVSGVTITVADRTVESDASGRFVVTSVPAGTYTLRATRLGYRDAEQSVTVASGQTTTVEIRLTPAPVGLEELVAIGYGEQQKKDVTGVVAEVPAEQFNTGRIVSAEELVSAKVAGVEVVQNNGGEPGGGISLRIRGGTSVTSSNEPLYVIDGVPLPVGGGLSDGRNPLNFLNPEDIESFTVLKDASATAIYGSQGANGVVLIETRSGRGMAQAPARVSFRANFSGSTVTGRPDILNAAQFRQVLSDQFPEGLDVIGDVSTDWRREVEQSAFGQDYTVAVSGANNKGSYRLSLGYLNQEGVVRASKNERLSLSVAYNQLLFDDRLNLSANVLGARNEDRFTPGGVLGNATNFAPTQPIYDPDSEWGGYFEWDDTEAPDNPVAILNMQSSEGTTYRSMGNLTAAYDLPFVDGLSVTGRGGYVVTNTDTRFFAPSNSKPQYDQANDGTVTRANPNELNWLLDAFATYARTWEQNTFDITGGYSYQQWRTESPSFLAQQLNSNLLGPNGIPAAEVEQTFLTIDESRLASWFARANYGYMDKYLLTASIRTDGSSKFGPGNQWGTFPSFAVGWRLSEESFMDSWESLSDLKLRLSWGKNGNQAFDSYQQYRSYSFGTSTAQVRFGDEYVGTIRPSAANPDIKWEQTSSWNLGLDYGLWNNRLAGALELYTKTTDDLIFLVPAAAGSNLSNYVTSNIGTVKNKGFELTVNALISEGVGDRFSWNANFNFAYNKNELVDINPVVGDSLVQLERIPTGNIAGGVGSTIQILQPGQPVNSFFVYQHKYENGKPIVGTDLEMYEDLNGDGIVNQDDRRPYKSPDPSWIIGHTSIMRWRKFDASFTLLAKIGNYVYNNIASSTGFYDQLRDVGSPNNLHTSVLDYEFQSPQYFSDVYVENASYLRMQNIQVGYQFTPRFRAFGVIQNAFTITGYDGIDPTAGINGIDNNIYPSTRTFTAGLNVAF
ncbi:MAG: SusC/RagA family TonB-linked outer membrane protein [Gemmatimonadales bacterium]|jgi:iron complex outermembrane receptor protein